MFPIQALTVLPAALLAATSAAGTILYVDDDAPGDPGPNDKTVSDPLEDGTEDHPFDAIQEAIDAAEDTDEIVVAPGTYIETIQFLGKAIWLHSSDGPALTIIGPTLSQVVVCHNGEGRDTKLEGFTLTGGGVGMYNVASSPTVINCVFSNNQGYAGAGAMYNLGGSSPMITNCTFSGNSAQHGAGMLNWDSDPIVSNCTFRENTASENGGAIACILGSEATITNCTFSGNSAQYGGGVFLKSSAATITNCTFSGNSAPNSGGGIQSTFSSRATVINCTFSGNTYGAICRCNSAGPTNVANTVLWNNPPQAIVGVGSGMVSYSNVQGGWPGIGNFDADPMFVDPGNGDYRLMPSSPCIDAGNNWGVAILQLQPLGTRRLQDVADLDGDGDTTELTPWDLDGSPRFADHPATADTGCGIPVIADMGAYEFQGDPAEIIYADLTGDGVVGTADFEMLLDCWSLSDGPCCLADLDLDGAVGIVDFLILLGNWG
ncbi:MAG: right-handed parallel beta-helix repeat-containing protein [Planctomycetota bacterium]|jgi:parallel beta-helix repeat protein